MTHGRLRLAVVGCGAVAERGHLPAAAGCPEVELAALVDPVRARAETLARRFGVPRVGEGHQGLEAAVDAAIVATPHALHAAVAVDLLERGVHVLVEKPMAVTTAECDAMIAAAERSGAVLAVGLMRRFQPGVRAAKAALDARTLGALRTIDIRDGFVFTWPTRSHFFFRKADAGGGVLLNVGSHDLDVLLWWLGEPGSLEYSDDAEGGLEADALLRFATRGGARGVVELSVTRTLRNTAVLTGERGRLEVPLYEPDPDPMRAQLEDFVRAVRCGRPPFVTGVEGRRSIALVEACYRRRRPLQMRWTEPSGFVAPPSVSTSTKRKSETVLVTGATGFIGGRLVESLVRERGTRVRALVARLQTAARLARFDVEMVSGSLADAGAVRAAAEGCDAVFHCAHPREGPPQEVRAAVREGTRNVAEAVAACGARRLITLSSFVVYGPHDGALDETASHRASGWSYADGKIEAEQALMEHHHRIGLPVVILQPGIVYGPWGGWWTAGQLDLMRNGSVGLVGRGEGLCNAVYVDDVVQAMLAAATQGAPGERYLVSAVAPVTWGDYYRALAEILGRPDAVVPLDDQRPSPEPGVVLPEAVLVPYLRSRTHVRIEKARHALGYSPRFDLARGMERTREWARWANFVSA